MHSHMNVKKVQWLLYIPSGFTIQFIHSAQKVYFRDSYGSQNSKQLFSQTETTYWLLQSGWCVFTVQYELNL